MFIVNTLKHTEPKKKKKCIDVGSLSIQIIQKSNQAWVGLAVCSTQCCSA